MGLVVLISTGKSLPLVLLLRLWCGNLTMEHLRSFFFSTNTDKTTATEQYDPEGLFVLVTEVKGKGNGQVIAIVVVCVCIALVIIGGVGVFLYRKKMMPSQDGYGSLN
mmetsp:Transcript_189/g.361  ORF Transcript_189/g.361 Transcript_189/m.361 type:complete len:108 (+) Transcript_189:779-1102(+)